MAGESPLSPGGPPSVSPLAGNWPPPYVGLAAPHTNPWSAIVITVAAAWTAATLTVSLTGPPPSSLSKTNTTTAAYTSAQTNPARQQLRDTYMPVTRMIEADTSGKLRAHTQIAGTISRVLVGTTGDNAAFDTHHGTVARALATAYGTVAAKGNSVVGGEAGYRAALDNVIAEDGAMKKVCGGA